MFDVISIGDATLDTFVTVPEATLKCSLNKENCWICFDYADKIAVSEFKQVIGGNAANNAVGSSRLGLKSAIYTVVGDDITGQKIKDKIRAEGVSMRFVRVDKGDMTNYSVVLSYKGERTILVYHHPRKYRLPSLTKSKWIYLTSIGEGHEVLHDKIIKHTRTNGVKLGFNPGTHQLKEGIKALEPIMRHTTAFIVNKEEGQDLVGKRYKNIKSVVFALKKYGPEIVVVTDGPKGTYAYDGLHFYYMKIFPAPRIEATGAGDSFSTGFISALVYGRGIDEALKWGNINAASVIQQVGPQAGLMKKSAMLKAIRNHPRYKSKKLI